MKLNWITKLITIGVLAAGFSSISMAQGAGPSGGKLTQKPAAKSQRRPLIEALSKLNLTVDQKTKIKGLEKTRAEDMKAFRQAHKGDKDALKTHAEESTKTFMAGIKGVLTSEQWDRFQAALRNMRGQGRGKRGGATPPSAKP